jgi:hypothetical protein
MQRRSRSVTRQSSNDQKKSNSKKFRTHGLIFSTAAGSENKTFTKLSPNSDFVRLSKNPRIAHQLSSRVFV